MVAGFDFWDSELSALGDLTVITGGYKPYQVGYGKSIEGDFPQTKKDVENWVYHSDTKIDDSYYPDIKGGNIQHYYIKPNTQWVKWGNWLMSPKKLEDFVNPKIVVREVTGMKLNASYDDSGYFTNDTTHMIRGVDPESLKYVLSIINSKLIGWYFRKFFGESNDLFPKIKVNELKDLPIKVLVSENQRPFIEKATSMLLFNKELQNLCHKFSNYLSAKYKTVKLNSKLEQWYDLDFPDFIKELNKSIKSIKGTPLTKNDEFDWLELFNENKQSAQKLINIINSTDKEIDLMVYKLYDLTEDEIKIINEI